MSEIRRGPVCAGLCVGLLWCTAICPFLFAQQRSTPRATATVEVRLRLIPFYAVDRKGRPVHDLRPDEIEVRIDGQPYPVDHLDRYVFQPFRDVTGDFDRSPHADRTRTPGLHRQVIFLFDLVFMSIRGLKQAKRIALEIVDRLLDTDQTYFLTFSWMDGLRQYWGPLAGRARVRRQVMRVLYPKRASGEVPPPGTLPSTMLFQPVDHDGSPVPLEFHVWRARTLGPWIYQDIAFRLADTFEYLASVLQPFPGPKLLIYFSEGVRNDVYFARLYGPARHGEGFLFQVFRPVMRKLSEAGVMFIAVHPEGILRSADDARSGENALRHMVREARGVFLEGRDFAGIGRRIQHWTTAYYEAGVYLQQVVRGGKFRNVDIRVRRPGVRIWTVRGLHDPRPYRDLSRNERLAFAMQLVMRGEDPRLPQPAGMQLYSLEGHFESRPSDARHILEAEFTVPPAVRGHRVDIFSIVIGMDPNGTPRYILSADTHRERLSRADSYRLTVRVPQTGPYLWGVVIVDPDSGTTWWRRWRVSGP